MTSDLLTPIEATAMTPHRQLLDEVSAAIIAAFADPHGPAYDRARSLLARVPESAVWVVELVVEAECAANASALPMPCGLRKFR